MFGRKERLSENRSSRRFGHCSVAAAASTVRRVGVGDRLLSLRKVRPSTLESRAQGFADIEHASIVSAELARNVYSR